MSTSENTATFKAGSVERVLDEFRATNDAVEALFRVHVGHEPSDTLDRETVENALSALNANVCLALGRGNQHTEFLHCEDGDWYSLTKTSTGRVGPIPLYPHNVEDRLGAYHLEAVKVNASPFATAELPAHNLDEDEVMLDV